MKDELHAGGACFVGACVGGTSYVGGNLDDTKVHEGRGDIGKGSNGKGKRGKGRGQVGGECEDGYVESMEEVEGVVHTVAAAVAGGLCTETKSIVMRQRNRETIARQLPGGRQPSQLMCIAMQIMQETVGLSDGVGSGWKLKSCFGACSECIFLL